ncbi:MAG: hypothetical protein JNL32_00750 [Candidatus Kapabacteria bacterium]|nr:hypothetical protein [Candidatus Kapabacteria bacterium]
MEALRHYTPAAPHQQFEYKIECIEFDDWYFDERRVVERLNECGADGWQAVTLSVLPRIAYNEREIRVLMVRPVQHTTTPLSS